ncbi:SH3 domain-containing protein C23A1.17-like [Perognathus longimembris pacificus]|uniref:SH3 domain-containing protein C23A1.17-like n=1 Tax=Perognathus longimembris pacificus TaxID=214514 RepID=UPI00201A1E11|nr:SH3 domain-containing protein C23A1.17-like [Perognathus longimembris pacificus]XP_048193197.1 SH3 domain-containing protein C23A1.17-like [Perognathus longimembris pacificus]
MSLKVCARASPLRQGEDPAGPLPGPASLGGVVCRVGGVPGFPHPPAVRGSGPSCLSMRGVPPAGPPAHHGGAGGEIPAPRSPAGGCRPRTRSRRPVPLPVASSGNTPSGSRATSARRVGFCPCRPCLRSLERASDLRFHEPGARLPGVSLPLGPLRVPVPVPVPACSAPAASRGCVPRCRVGRRPSPGCQCVGVPGLPRPLSAASVPGAEVCVPPSRPARASRVPPVSLSALAPLCGARRVPPVSRWWLPAGRWSGEARVGTVTPPLGCVSRASPPGSPAAGVPRPTDLAALPAAVCLVGGAGSRCPPSLAPPPFVGRPGPGERRTDAWCPCSSLAPPGLEGGKGKLEETRWFVRWWCPRVPYAALPVCPPARVCSREARR